MENLSTLGDLPSRWRLGGIGSGIAGDTCPLCHAGYVFARCETVPHPDLAHFCYTCQNKIEALCRQVASGLTILLGQSVDVFDVLTRFFGVVAPFSPMAQAFGAPYPSVVH